MELTERYRHLNEYFQLVEEFDRQLDDGSTGLIFSCIKCLPQTKTLQTLTSDERPLSAVYKNLKSHIVSKHSSDLVHFQSVLKEIPNKHRKRSSQASNNSKSKKMKIQAKQEFTLDHFLNQEKKCRRKKTN